MHMTNVSTYTWSLTQFVILVSILFAPFIVYCITTENSDVQNQFFKIEV